MNEKRMRELMALHRDQLLNDTIPFRQKHNPDPEYGGLFNLIDRDGTVSHTLKGSRWDTAFHLARMQLYFWHLLEEMLAG